LFDRIRLGPYEDVFQKALEGASCENLDHITAVLILLKPPKLDRVLLPPSPTKYDAINVLQFYLYPWKLLLKIDKRDFTHPFDKLALKVGSPACALIQEFCSEGEQRMLLDLRDRAIKAGY